MWVTISSMDYSTISHRKYPCRVAGGLLELRNACRYSPEFDYQSDIAILRTAYPEKWQCVIDKYCISTSFECKKTLWNNSIDSERNSIFTYSNKCSQAFSFITFNLFRCKLNMIECKKKVKREEKKENRIKLAKILLWQKASLFDIPVSVLSEIEHERYWSQILTNGNCIRVFLTRFKQMFPIWKRTQDPFPYNSICALSMQMFARVTDILFKAKKEIRLN